MLRHFFAAILVVLLCVTSARAEEVEGVSARERVEHLHAAILKVMIDAKNLGYTGRYDELEPTVRQSYDLPLITKLSIGRYWKDLETRDKVKLVDAVTRLTIATYAARFKGYSGQNFEVFDEETTEADVVVIKSRLNRTDNEPVQFDYVLRNSDDGWHIVDVFLDGKYSELATRRSEYTGVIGRSGVDDLLDTIEEKISFLRDDSVRQ